MPAESDSHSRKFRYPFNAYRILSATPPQVVESFFKNGQAGPNPVLLQPLLKFFETKSPVNSLLAGYVSGTLAALFEAKPLAMYSYFLEHDSILTSLLVHRYDISVCNFLQKVFLRSDYFSSMLGENSEQSPLQKSIDALSLRIVKELVDGLSSDYSQSHSTLATLASCFEDFALSQPNLREYFFSDSTLTKLFDISFQALSKEEDGSKSLIDIVMRILVSLISDDDHQSIRKSNESSPTLKRQVTQLALRLEAELFPKSPTVPLSDNKSRKNVGRVRISFSKFLWVALSKHNLSSEVLLKLLPALLELAQIQNDVLWKNLLSIFQLALRSPCEKVKKEVGEKLLGLLQLQLNSWKNSDGKNIHLLPNRQVMFDLINQITKIEPPFTDRETIESLSDEIYKLKVNDDGYPRPDHEDLQFSELMADMKHEEDEDDLLGSLQLPVSENKFTSAHYTPNLHPSNGELPQNSNFEEWGSEDHFSDSGEDEFVIRVESPTTATITEVSKFSTCT